MNDDQLKREIEEALAAEPSPQFLARVRRQIAAEPRPVRLAPWFVVSAGLLAASLLIGIIVLRPQEKSERKPENVVVVTPSEPPPPASPETPPVTNIVPRVASVPTTRPAKAAEVEVLIDPREVAAFRSFVERIEDRKIAAAKLEELFAAAEKTGTGEIMPMPIAGLEPIVIQPLIPAASERGGDL
jgi:hypothetical protein